MTKARHAAYNPRKLIITIAISLAVVALLAVIGSPRTHRATAEPKPVTTTAPAPQPTWTSYVPVASQQCIAMLETSDALYKLLAESAAADKRASDLTVQGFQDKDPGKLNQAHKMWDANKKRYAGGDIQKADDRFHAQFDKCAES